MALLAMDDDGRKMTEMESRQLLRRESVGRASRGSDARRPERRRRQAKENGTPVREDIYGCTV